ncbi:transposase [Colletotrichum incanum]|nr:transposase [Colletotrichum incanum]
MAQHSIESDLVLALNALHVRKAALIYNVPRTTLQRRQAGRPAKGSTRSHNLILTSYEEDSIIRYIIDLDSRSFPPRLSGVREMADRLLRERDARRVGTNWAANFVRRRPELRTRFNRRIDYQRVLCEDPDAYRAWFFLVRNIIAKYGIHDDDIYNFDETGFAMGKISSEMVVTTSDRLIQGIGSYGYSIPPYIIFAGKVHLDSWTCVSPLPPNWKGLEWVKHFDFHTRSRTKGAYRLLILDGHESHHSVDFELHCKEHKIVTLCMPAHSSHKLQPLDVGCFSPLKRAYGKEIEGLMRVHITHIAKEDFLPAFYKAYNAAMTKSNIQAGFRATGLVPYDPDYVISQLDIKLRMLTPPGSSAGLPPAWVPKTLNNLVEITLQSDYISDRILKKGMMMIVHEQTLMRSDLAELREANDRLSRCRRGTLIIDQAKDFKSQIDATEQLRVEISQNSGRARRPETRATMWHLRRAWSQCSYVSEG